MGAGRSGAIDSAKALAAVAVVFTHARRTLFPAVDSWDFWLCGSWTSFQVPTFLFASGFLASSATPVAFSRLRERWLRVIVPYAVASALAYAVGVARAADASELLFQLATASTLGVYYYVFLIALIAPLAWPLSRVPALAPLALVACGAVLVFVVARGGGALLPWFWALRDPLDHFALGFFLLGWLARRHEPLLARAWSSRRAALAGAIAVGVALGPVATAGLLPRAAEVPARVAYTLAVIALCATSARGRSPVPVVAWLSQASLAVYLFHRIFQRLLEAPLASWPDPARVLALVGAGLGGAILVARAAQHALGPARARFWWGA